MPRIPDFAAATCGSDVPAALAEIRVSRRGACARIERAWCDVALVRVRENRRVGMPPLIARKTLSAR